MILQGKLSGRIPSGGRSFPLRLDKKEAVDELPELCEEKAIHSQGFLLQGADRKDQWNLLPVLGV